MIIQIPLGNYDCKQFAEFCNRFGCELMHPKRGEKHLLTVFSDDPVNFFWLGCNLNFFHKTGTSISAASQIFT